MVRTDIRQGSATALTDRQVMASVVEARPDALAMLYDRYSRLLFSLAVRILGDPEAAADAVQEAFLSVWRRGDMYGEECGSVQAWLCSMVHKSALDRLRGPQRRHRALLALEGIAAAPQVEGTAVREALGSLPAQRRDVIELAYFAGCSQAEIGDRLRIPPGTVRSQMRLAVRALHATLM